MAHVSEPQPKLNLAIFTRKVNYRSLPKKLHSKSMTDILYSQKYWQKLNSAVEPKITIARILADLNLAVRIAIRIPYPPENKPPPPFFSSRHHLDWGGGLFSNMHFPSSISPPWPPLAVAMWKDDTIVGHIPREISRVCWGSFSPKERQQTTIGGGERTCSVCVCFQRKAKAS